MMKPTGALCCVLVLSLSCRQKLFLDGDGDGYDLSEDCDDTTELISPDREEICNGVDDDCNGIVDDAPEDAFIAFFVDADGDGYGAGEAVMACQAPEGMVQQDGDCDDTNPEAYPYRTELCNGWDDDCDGDIDTDAEDQIDLSGYGWRWLWITARWSLFLSACARLGGKQRRLPRQRCHNQPSCNGDLQWLGR